MKNDPMTEQRSIDLDRIVYLFADARHITGGDVNRIDVGPVAGILSCRENQRERKVAVCTALLNQPLVPAAPLVEICVVGAALSTLTTLE